MSLIDKSVYMKQWRKDKDKGRTETCYTFILFTTKPTWTSLGLNLGLRSERPENIHLGHSPFTVRNYCIQHASTDIKYT